MADHVDHSSGDEADVEDEQMDENDQVEKKKNMAGMIDVIGKILNKKINTDEKGVILSKYKEGKKRKLQQEEETIEKKAKAKIKSEFKEKNHVVPDRSNADKEVSLRKIGTRGVVKLFNAVAKHQKEIDSKLKKVSTEVKKDKVMDSMSKSSFLDMLKTDSTSKKSKKESVPGTMQKKRTDKEEPSETQAPSWDILRDDFMMGSKMKDWDKEDNEQNGSDENPEQQTESESSEESD
eukprot:Seg169.10 transcript_id=Seg169.10/GoldUCD/mRNA.D3Y31 product="RRP15-like protein" protein_id=Seg169.10/GoldUCD/D3Y31